MSTAAEAASNLLEIAVVTKKSRCANNVNVGVRREISTCTCGNFCSTGWPIRSTINQVWSKCTDRRPDYRRCRARASHAEHAADAAAIHFSQVCRLLNMPQPEPQVIERARLAAVRSQVEIMAWLRACPANGAGLR